MLVAFTDLSGDQVIFSTDKILYFLKISNGYKIFFDENTYIEASDAVANKMFSIMPQIYLCDFKE